MTILIINMHSDSKLRKIFVGWMVHDLLPLVNLVGEGHGEIAVEPVVFDPAVLLRPYLVVVLPNTAIFIGYEPELIKLWQAPKLVEVAIN